MGTDDVVIECYFATPFESYLQGCVAFELPEMVLNTIRIKRGVSYGQDIAELSQQTLELSFADALMYAVTSPSIRTGVKDSDGGWSHSEGNTTMNAADKSYYKTQASSIYKKYDDESYSNTGVRFKSLNGSPLLCYQTQGFRTRW